MPKNDNAHSLRLQKSLEDSGHAELAQAIAQSCPLSKSADVAKKYAWACSTCEQLASALSPTEAAQIRRACRCNDGTSMAKEIAGCIKKSATLKEACTLFSAQNKYAFLEYISEHELHFGYHACVCSCVKRAEGDVPHLWCECSAGYAEAMFQQVLGPSVKVALLESVKSGAKRCVLRIEW